MKSTPLMKQVYAPEGLLHKQDRALFKLFGNSDPHFAYAIPPWDNAATPNWCIIAHHRKANSNLYEG